MARLVEAVVIVGAPIVTLLDTSADLQAAIDNTQDGGVLRLGPGIYYLTTTAGLDIDHPMTIEGSGGGTYNGSLDFVTGSYGTVIVPMDGGDGFTVTNVLADDVAIKNLVIARPTAPGSVGTGDAIKVTVTTSNRTGIVIENVIVWNMGRDGLHVEADPGYSLNLLSVTRSQFKGCGRYGVYLKSAAFPTLESVWCAANRSHGMYADGCGLMRVRGCSFEGNQADGSAALYDAQVRLKLCHSANVEGCSFETYYNRAVKVGLTLTNCYGGRVEGNYFGNPAVDEISAGVPSLAQLQATIGIVLMENTQGCTVGTNVFDYVNTFVYIHPLASETPPAANYGNTVRMQACHNIDASMDGYSYIPTDTPTFVDSPSGLADKITVGRPDLLPGAVMAPEVTALPDGYVARVGMLCTYSAKLYLCTANATIVDGDITVPATWTIVGTQS